MKPLTIAVSVMFAVLAAIPAVTARYGSEAALQKAGENLPRKLGPDELAMVRPVPISVFQEKPQCEVGTAAVNDKQSRQLHIAVHFVPDRVANTDLRQVHIQLSFKPKCSASDIERETISFTVVVPKIRTIDS